MASLAPLLALQLAAVGWSQESASRPKNVLYIVVDDLRPQLGVYGQDHTGVASPNIDALGRDGTVFTRAYTQLAICGPSRNSFLSGRRPDTTRTWTFRTSFREAPGGETWQSMPQLFKDNGHITCGIGKTFHDDAVFSPPRYDLPYSWSPECACFPDDMVTGDGGWLPLDFYNLNQTCLDGYYSPYVDGCPEAGPYCEPSLHRDEFTDTKAASAAIAHLRRFKDGDRPFFLMVGIRRPHLSWAVPRSFLDAVPLNISVAEHKTAPTGMPEIAFFYPNHEGSELNAAAYDLPMLPDTPLPDEVAREMRRGYYAAVRFVDHEIGRVLDELGHLGFEDDTAVVLHGDHGWQLGEHGEWSKETNFELATRVPLIVKAPWLEDSRGAVISGPLVQLLDVYRSVAELAGLEPAEGVEGASFVDLLRREEQPEPDLEGALRGEAFSAAFSQYPRPFTCALAYPNQIEVMGYTVRTAEWRYTEWKPWNQTTLAPVWESSEYGSELYDHRGDDGTDMNAYENTNVLATVDGQRVAPALAIILRKQFSPDVPPSLLIFS